MKPLTAERLREALKYDPATGVFTRNDIPTGSVNAVSTYVIIGVDKGHYYAHRLAILYMTGSWPLVETDHINGNRSDNSWANLRPADKELNCQNLRRAKSHNKLGLLGVGRNGSGFMANLTVKGKRHYLGTFRTQELAQIAYIAAKRLLHPGGTL